jgi:hypothetical protein
MSEEINFLRPYLCKKERLGSKYDGGYVLPKDIVSETDVLVTFGVSTNIDFELQYHRRNPESDIVMIDPYIGITNDLMRLIKRVFRITKPVKRDINLRKVCNEKLFFPPLYIEIFYRLSHWLNFYQFISRRKVFFLKKGIASRTNETFLSVEDFWRKFSLEERKNILLKIDIEGSEYEILNDLYKKFDKVECLLLEVHDVNSKMSEVIDLIAQIQKVGLYLVHIHGNNSDIADERGIPNTLELSFAKEIYLADKSFDVRAFPDKELDSPCNPCYEDYSLRFLNLNI